MQNMRDVSLALAAGAPILGAAGEVQRQRAEARIADANADAARYDARLATERGAIEQARILREKGRIIGAQRASFAGQGVALGEGTPLALAEATEREAALDVMRARNDAALEALGYRQPARVYEYRSKLDKRALPGRVAGHLLAGGANYYKLHKGLGVDEGSFGIPGVDD